MIQEIKMFGATCCRCSTEFTAEGVTFNPKKEDLEEDLLANDWQVTRKGKKVKSTICPACLTIDEDSRLMFI